MSLIKNIGRKAAMLLKTTLGLGLIFVGGGLLLAYNHICVSVPHDMCAVWIAKSGAQPPSFREVAEDGEKGILRKTSGPGRYFYNPIKYDVELHPLIEIDTGDPSTWDWRHTSGRLISRGQPINAAGGNVNILDGELPKVGILTRKSGKPSVGNNAVVDMDSEFKGIVREVLTPGVYRINPYEFEVSIVDALVIPAGFVGVVTNQVGTQPDMIEVEDVIAGASPDDKPMMKMIQPLAHEGQRGTLRDVLPPGIYYLNPNVQKVKVIEVGYNEFSQDANKSSTDTIRFPSKSGFDIELGVTVVWGLHPEHAAQVINEFGNTEEILLKVIQPQLRSICRNEGSLYEARDFIQGEKREEFQRILTEKLHDVCASKNIELLLALISTIEVRSREGGPSEGETDLKTEIQDSFIAIERQITNEKLQETAKKLALLEEARKKVEVMRESIQADTRKKVAETLANGDRRAAEIAASARLEVATIEKNVADIDAERTEVTGRAEADVVKLKKQAEADGKRILVQALGSGQAYNMYTFAKNFEPQSIRLIFAGEGTFWTDLSKFEEVGAAKILKADSTNRIGDRADRN